VNILIISEVFPPQLNSGSKLIYELYVAAKNNNNISNAIVLTTQDISSEAYKERSENIHYVNLSIPKKKNFFVRGIREILMPVLFGLRAKKIIKKYSIDKVFIYSPPMPLALAKFFFRKTITILSIQDIFPQFAWDLKIIKSKFIFRLFLLMQKISIKINTRVLCQSNDCATYMKSIYPDQAHKIDFLLNWQSFNARKFKPKNGNESKKIIYVGNFGPAQDIHSYIHSLSEVSENYKIEFWGHGSELNKSLSVINGSNSNITFKGILDEPFISSEIQSSDFGLVILSNALTTPIIPGKILTYLEHGVPVIVIASQKSKIDKFLQSYGLGIFICTQEFMDNPRILIRKIEYFKKTYSQEHLKRFLVENLNPNDAIKKIFNL